VLLNEAPGHTYVAESGLIGGDYPNHKTVMAFSGGKAAQGWRRPDERALRVARQGRREAGQDLCAQARLVRNPGAPRDRQQWHAAGVAAAVHADRARTAASSRRARRSIPPSPAPAVYTTEQKFQKVDFSDIDKDKVDIQKESTTGYVAMVQHYFASAWNPARRREARAVRAQAARHQQLRGRHESRRSPQSRPGRPRRSTRASTPAPRTSASSRRSSRAWSW